MHRGCKPFDSQSLAGLVCDAACTDFIQHGIVVGGITDERYTFMVLCRGTDEGHAADVNVFDGICIRDIGLGNRLLERIEIDSDEVNVIPAEVKQLFVVCICGAGKQSAVDGGMQMS